MEAADADGFDADVSSDASNNDPSNVEAPGPPGKGEEADGPEDGVRLRPRFAAPLAVACDSEFDSPLPLAPAGVDCDRDEAGRIPEVGSARSEDMGGIAVPAVSAAAESRALSRTPNARAKRGADVGGVGSAGGAASVCGGISVEAGMEVAGETLAEEPDCVGSATAEGVPTSGGIFVATLNAANPSGTGIALARAAELDAVTGA